MLDEVDGFITSCKRKRTDLPFKAIENISKKCKNGFNVVFAGLNLYIDFKGNNGFFKKDNRIGLHLSEENFIHIEPFGIQEARELIERPLHYLGLDFSKSLSLIYLILDNANYYPCLIQLYCTHMLENLNIYSKNGPIYYVNNKLIYKLLGVSKFTDEVKDVFEGTLLLDSNGGDGKDDYTFRYLANILAFLCHTEGYKSYTLENFEKFAKANKIDKISKLSESDLRDLLDLLVELSVFEKCDDGSYRFRRFSLFKLIGETIDDIRKKIKKLKDEE